MKPRWYADPKLARTFSRATWLVLVGAFVLLTRFDAGAAAPYALLGLIAVVAFLNGPVVYGLVLSKDDSTTKAYRAVALMLLLRLGATAFVVWQVGARI